MKKIAIYGKGGIGKSTISSNISATLGMTGKKILQIGCDPKHDSTFILTNKISNILLEIVREKKDSLLKEDILVHGKYGVDCIEFGGPEPGIGCAGRGIIKGLSIIDNLNIIRDGSYDLTIYDILGDVVCGGFFEPLRNKKTDEMYIVTSGEFNSLFAANNLCNGYKNNIRSGNFVKLAGVIGNCRGIKNEDKILQEFCDSVGVPLLTLIPKDNRFEQCSVSNIPVVDVFKNSDLYYQFKDLCNLIMMEKKEQILDLNPLSFNELRNLYSRVYSL